VVAGASVSPQASRSCVTGLLTPAPPTRTSTSLTRPSLALIWTRSPAWMTTVWSSQASACVRGVWCWSAGSPQGPGKVVG